MRDTSCHVEMTRTQKKPQSVKPTRAIQLPSQCILEAFNKESSQICNTQG